MYHHVFRTRDGGPLFRSWSEGLALWAALTRAAPGLTALVIMPNHVHLLHRDDLQLRLRPLLSGFTRRQQVAWMGGFPGFARMRAPSFESDPQKIRRLVRYLALNPCRAQLVRDPLAWPLSTHRDSVGLVVDPILRPHPRPAQHHRFVSGDPSAAIAGTPFPIAPKGTPSAEAVADAVCGLLRVPASALRVRGPARTHFLMAARALEVRELARVAEIANCAMKTVYHAESAPPDLANLMRQVLGDPRFHALPVPEPGRGAVWHRLGGPGVRGG